VVAGSGTATIRLVDPGGYERRYEIDLGAQAAHALLRLCVEQIYWRSSCPSVPA